MILALRDELRESATREITARVLAALEKRRREAREQEPDPAPERRRLQ
jgi:hypothetical protein